MMQPSNYQVAILEWLKTGKGHGCCNAVAGAGKSSTLRMAAQQLESLGISPRDVKVIVFGKANSLDLMSKFGAAWKDSISTLHSTGFSLLKRELGIRNSREVKVTDTKYRWIAQALDLIGKRGQPHGTLRREGAIAKDEDLIKLINLIRLTNSQATVEAVKELVGHFEIEDIYQPVVVAKAIAECLKLGEQQARDKEAFDFTDQIWLPVKWQLGSKPMGFAGTDNRSYQKILKRTQATELPLSICYRCPVEHIRLVNRVFPEIPIEAHENAAVGTITQIEERDLEQHLRIGDMVISRKTAPLVTLCIMLIAKGIAATVKGRDIGEVIKRDLEEIGSMPGFRYENFNEAVRQYRAVKFERYQGLDNEEKLKETLNDKLEALTAIYQSQPQAQAVTDLAAYIDELFSDKASPITLSTCHRAKGLEGDRIFIHKALDLPFTWRNQLPWQKEQEDNLLLYVALTRSKSELFIVGEPDWLDLGQENEPGQVIEPQLFPAAAENSPTHSYPKSVDIPDSASGFPVPDYPDGESELADETVNILSEAEIVEPATVNELQFLAVAEPTPTVKTQRRWLAPALIHLDGNTQSRAVRLDNATVERYAEEMHEGRWNFEREPLPVVFDDGESLWAGDVHHRAAAAVKAKIPEMMVEVRSGTERDARIYSASANKYHGLPRSNADKRAAVKLLLIDGEWQQKSDRALAEHSGVSAPFVAKVRADLAKVGTVNVPTERIDKSGRKIETANIGTRPKSQPESLNTDEQLGKARATRSQIQPSVAQVSPLEEWQKAERTAQIKAEIATLQARLTELEAELMTLT